VCALGPQLCATFDAKGCPEPTVYCPYLKPLCVGKSDTARCNFFDSRAMVSCTADSQCYSGKLCREDPTVPTQLLGPSGLVCALPCQTDLDCTATHKCDGSGHCQARTCAECPSYFSCTGGTCVIPSCSTDSDCPGGFCVNGNCSASLGVCQECIPN